MENEKLLDIKNLSVTYKTEDGIVYAVNDLNLEIGQKETLGFVGETGAGKTTTALTQLAVAAIVIAVVLGTFLGIISAVKQNSLLDNAVMVLALIGTSAPIFWIGILMILLFSVKLGWLPPSGFGSFKQLIMPALALGMQSTAVIARMTRSSMLEVIRQDFVKTARAKGQKEIVVILKHVFRNALIPVITVVGLQFGTLLGGAMLTEVVFSIPGVGRLMIEAIKQRDFPIVQGSVLFVAACFSLVNLAVDLLYAVVDPKVAKE